MKILLINPSYGKINKCWWLWRAPQVNADGGITPCCYKVEKSSDFGDVSKNSFKDIWNDENCASARNLFCKDNVELASNKVCGQCDIAKDYRKNILENKQENKK